MIEMIWKGDQVRNLWPRFFKNKQFIPLAIVDHISVGTVGSVDEWFQNADSEASSHFIVCRNGTIHQYVRIEDAAWTQGLSLDAIAAAPAGIVRQLGVNPNLYCVSIEHEGYADNGVDGELTEEQFWASCWLHKYIQHEVERIWGHHIQFSPQFVLGHFQIDPKRKPFCPGPNFPWARLYAELAVAEGMLFEAYEERIHFHLSGSGDFAKAYQASERARDLGNKLTDTRWGKAAEAKLLSLQPVLPGMETAQQVVDRVLDLYRKFNAGGQFAAEALRKLLIVYAQMKKTGLL